MPNIFRIILLLTFATAVSACGLKGKLKTPEQIEKLEAKKAQEEAKKAQEEAAEDTDSNADSIEKSVEKK